MRVCQQGIARNKKGISLGLILKLVRTLPTNMATIFEASPIKQKMKRITINPEIRVENISIDQSSSVPDLLTTTFTSRKFEWRR